MKDVARWPRSSVTAKRRCWVALRYSAIVLVAFLVLDGLWVGVRGERARSHLLKVRDAVATAERLALANDFSPAESMAFAAVVQRDTASARRLTSDPIWHLNGHLPWLGTSFQDVQVMADVSNDLARAVLPSLGAAISTTQGQLASGQRGQLDLTAFLQAAGSLRADVEPLRSAVVQLQALPPEPALGVARTARDALVQTFSRLSDEISTPALAAEVGPKMLGVGGPRTYFVALVNPAELRGGGGIIGGYAYLQADGGKLSLQGGGSDTDLQDFPTDVTTLGAAFQARWESAGVERSWRNANLSPDFPSTAKILEAMSARRGRPVDGVISLDPAGAGELLAATNPITTADGTHLGNAHDVEDYVESELYALYPRDPQDQPARKAAIVDLQSRLFGTVSKAQSARTVLSALGQAAGEGHLRLASARPAEESVLASTPLGGAVPRIPGPFAGVSLLNSIGNKTDFYLERDLSWTAAACPAGGADRISTQTVTLTNHAPGSGLTSYVGGSSDPALKDLPPGSDRLFVSVYGGVGGEARSATLDGRDVAVNQATEGTHPVVATYVTLQPGQSRVLKVNFFEPSAGTVQPPLLGPVSQPSTVSVDVPACLGGG